MRVTLDDNTDSFVRHLATVRRMTLQAWLHEAVLLAIHDVDNAEAMRIVCGGDPSLVFLRRVRVDVDI